MIEALLAAQQRPGSGPPESVTLPGWIGVEYHAGTYNHLLALRALLTYRARYPDAHPDGLDEALRRALPLVLELRRPSGGFGYLKSTAPSNPYDSNLTLWSAWVLALGGEAGLLESDVVEPVLEGAARIVSDLTDPGTGRLGYGPREDQGGPGGPPSRFRETIDVYLPDATESLTAFAIYAERRFLPDTERQDEGAIRLGRLSEKRIERVLACRPVDGRAGYDLFSWYFGLLALGLVGGDEAAEWEAACFEQLVARQSRDEASRGAWPPDDAWGQTGGWVYSTAMAILCLAQTSWLHPPLRAPVAADEQ